MADPYSGALPNDVLYDPVTAARFRNVEDYATAIASQSYPHMPNTTSFLQNERSSMFPAPMAALWSGNEIRTPNLTSPSPVGPRPSVFSAWLLESIARIQQALAGAP